MVAAQVVRDVVECGLGEQAQRLGLDGQEGAAAGSFDSRHPLGGQQPIFGGVLTDRQQVLVEEVGHSISWTAGCVKFVFRLDAGSGAL